MKGKVTSGNSRPIARKLAWKIEGGCLENSLARKNLNLHAPHPHVHVTRHTSSFELFIIFRDDRRDVHGLIWERERGGV